MKYTKNEIIKDLKEVAECFGLDGNIWTWSDIIGWYMCSSDKALVYSFDFGEREDASSWWVQAETYIFSKKWTVIFDYDVSEDPSEQFTVKDVAVMLMEYEKKAVKVQEYFKNKKNKYARKNL